MKNDNELVSIIIPVYNVEKYVEKCIDSVLNQTYKNLEIIIINDGSTDNSEQICKDYQKKDKRIKYFQKENTGVSDTRNKGIELSKGKYICFVDSDDILNKTYIEDFIDCIKNNNCEMVCCNFQKFKSNCESLDVKDISKYTIEKRYNVHNKYALLYEKFGGYIANKIFCADIIKNKNIKMDLDIYMMEDMNFVYKYIEYTNNIICIDKDNYKYRTLQTTASKNLRNTKWFSLFKTLDNVLKNKEYTKEIQKNIEYMYYYYLYQAKYRLNYIKDNSKYDRIKKEIKERIKETNVLTSKLDLKQKIKIIIYKYLNTPAFYIKIKKNLKT